MRNKKIIIGSDEVGFPLKVVIVKHLEGLGYEVNDLGTKDYCKIGAEVASEISNDRCERGILVCGSGMGMAIAANKFKGVYAAVCESVYAAKYSRIINNSNILALGHRILGDHMALEIVDTWLRTEFAEDYAPARQQILKDLFTGLQELEKQQYK